jgi:hypothetical protein
MKKLLSFTLAATVAFCGAANAADVEAGVVKSIPKQINNFLKTHTIAPEVLQAFADKKPTTKGPATGITQFDVIAVGSGQYGGWESIGQYQYGTIQDHGGSPLYIAVAQVGYGNANQATMNGLSKSALSTVYLCGSDLHTCQVGETLVGYLYYYDFTGQSNGQFKASSNSVASPFGYWSDTVYIK